MARAWQDIDRLRSMLVTLLVTKQLVGNVLEMLTPMMARWAAAAGRGKKKDKDGEVRIGRQLVGLWRISAGWR
jgi:hypothetical protein